MLQYYQTRLHQYGIIAVGQKQNEAAERINNLKDNKTTNSKLKQNAMIKLLTELLRNKLQKH